MLICENNVINYNNDININKIVVEQIIIACQIIYNNFFVRDDFDSFVYILIFENFKFIRKNFENSDYCLIN